MRRPRSKLQVSMFPFLAVLLCVMEALLLILFVMDRRAKIAAQHQVSEIKSARLARSKAEEEARKAEWEKAKEALHQSLLSQQDLLKDEAKDLDRNLSDANKKIELAKLKDADLKKKAAEEFEKIALLQLEIANQQNGAKESSKKENVSKAELLEAAKELADLEYAFKKLRSLKQNEKATYSLVPYRGKRGDMRPPIYVECVGEGILFHPEKKLLSGPYFTITSVRSEVERRAGPLAVEKAASKDKTDRSVSYVLFLIRPNGIENYYKAQSYLKGYQLDFGYELVDQHWTLDFGVPGNAMPVQLANANGPPKGDSPGALMFPGNSGGNAGTPGNGQIGPPPGIGSGNASPFGVGNGQIGPPPGIGAGNASPFGVGNGQIGPPPGIGSGNVGAPPLSPPFGTGVGTGNPGSPFSIQPPNASQGFGTPIVGSPPTVGNPSYNGVTTGIPVNRPSFVPISRIAPPIPIATTGDGSNLANRVPSLNVPPGPKGYSNAGNMPNSAGTATPAPNPNATPGNGNAPANPMTIGGNGANPANPSANPIAATGNLNNGSSAPPNANASTGNTPGEPPSDGNPNDAPNPDDRVKAPQFPGSGDGNADPNARPSPFRPLPNFGGVPPEKKKTTTAPPLGRVLGNKDFIITIDCHSEHVSVFPGGMTFRWTAANMKATDQALVQAITNLIAKRQVSVRPGEPAYRPVIRFQVSAEGLRSYYQAYPLLESLGVPMRRENTVE